MHRTIHYASVICSHINKCDPCECDKELSFGCTENVILQLIFKICEDCEDVFEQQQEQTSHSKVHLFLAALDFIAKGDGWDRDAIAIAAESLEYSVKHRDHGLVERGRTRALERIQGIIDDVNPSSIYIADDTISQDGCEWDMEKVMVDPIIEYAGDDIAIIRINTVG
ncbi:hypothetical protein VFPPC_18287 [Pochonia chlamydosporia 170]|uniref:C2H2-type domain-containing protein n=1 Tax=Pochonia chlamydosporia 170 TaxID=1380566 RepID=A0A219ANY9_METCM|nr:hypothetical protein VFPPC_18287 [Pochonia chlamydosporia 170]OWT42548.1 hypothetical protein VFPPC_18287 [Pochonia chlamydosporia 170]